MNAKYKNVRVDLDYELHGNVTYNGKNVSLAQISHTRNRNAQINIKNAKYVDKIFM